MATRRSRSSRRTQCGCILLLFTIIVVITFTQKHSDETTKELDMKAMQKELYAHKKKKGHQEDEQYLLRSSAHASEEEDEGEVTIDLLQDHEESSEIKIEPQASEEGWPQTNHAETVHVNITSPSELDSSASPDDEEASDEGWPQTNHASTVQDDIASPSELDPSASPDDKEASEEEWPQTYHGGTVHDDITSPSELDPFAPPDDEEASKEEWPQTYHAGAVQEDITSPSELDPSASLGDKKATATKMELEESEEEQIDPPKKSYTAASEKLTLSGSQDGERSPEIKSELRGRQPQKNFVHVSKNGGAVIDIKHGITRN